jgi:inner membrane transporter RhtA
MIRLDRAVPAPVMVVAAATSVQSGAAVAQRLFSAVGPGGAVFLRLFFSSVVLLAIARPRELPHARADRMAVVAYGVVLAAMNLSFYAALDRVPLGVAVTVEFLGPLAVAIGASRRRLDLLWVAFAAAGVVLLADGGDGRLRASGLLFAALAGCCWAAYILLAQRVGRVMPGTGGLTVAMCIGTVLAAPYGVAAGGGALLHGSVIGKGAAIAVLSSAIPYSLELAALRRLSAGVFGILMSLEPAIGALSGFVFLGQHLHLAAWLAVLCVMVASVGATVQSTQPSMAELPAAPDRAAEHAPIAP